MSHIAEIEIEIKDLDALEAAARSLGLELARRQTTYRWYGELLEGHPLPAGFTKADLGRCDHAIRVPGNDRAYEIGVVKRRDGRPGYALLWDFWKGGFGMQEKVGENADRLKQAYAVEVAKKAARCAGLRILVETRKADGSVVLRIAPGGWFGWTR